MFNEYPFLERFKEAHDCGFEYVEYLFPYQYDKNILKKLLQEHNLKQVLFNAAPGNKDGDKGLACYKDRQSEFHDSIYLAIEYASTLDVKQIHIMSGNDTSNNTFDIYIQNIAWACDLLRKENINVLLEPINTMDMPNYLLHSFSKAISIIEEINTDNLKLQFDIYHCQRMNLNIMDTIKKYYAHIAHFQIANTPGRHEPVDGDINYHDIWNLLEQLHYQNWIGCEYFPKGDTKIGLQSWFNTSIQERRNI